MSRSTSSQYPTMKASAPSQNRATASAHAATRMSPVTLDVWGWLPASQIAGFAGLISLRAGIAMSSLRQLVACSVLAVGVVGFSPALPLAYQSWHGPALAGREVCGAVASSRAAAIQPRSPRPHLGSARCLCASGDTWERWGDDGDISLWGEGLGIW